MISDELGLKITSDCDFEDYVFEGHHNVSKSCTDAIEAANRIVGDYINNYDVILDVCYPSIVEQELRLRRYVSTPPPPPCSSSRRRQCLPLIPSAPEPLAGDQDERRGRCLHVLRAALLLQPAGGPASSPRQPDEPKLQLDHVQRVSWFPTP